MLVMSPIYSTNFVFEKRENKQKEDGVGPFFIKKVLNGNFLVEGSYPLNEKRVDKMVDQIDLIKPSFCLCL